MAVAAGEVGQQRTADAVTVLDVRSLSAAFFTRRGVVRAVSEVSFTLQAGDTLGLVGESGCGKSATALAILRALPFPGRVTGGQVLFQGEDLLAKPEREMRRIRGRQIAMIPQDPTAALNPLLTVGDHLAEVLDVHLGQHGRAAREHSIELLERVGIPEPARRLHAYPHQLSGGMRQRVLIADEPTTALDATVQAQILELLASLSRQLHMATILITHNLGIVAGMCDRVAVMYAGRIVEMAPRDELFTATRHPYTAGLLRCVPRLDRLGPGWIQSIPGQPPDLSQLPPGCSFAPRCPLASELCLQELPALRSHGPGHSAACWNAEQIGELLASPNGWAGDRLQAEVHPVQTSEPEQSRPAQARPLVEVRHLTVHFPVRSQGWFSRQRLAVHAVDGVSFDIAPGETLGLVGASGCGKSTTGRALVGLYHPTSGQVLFDGHDLAQLPPDVLRSMRRRFQIVFQDPFSALNPRMTAGALVGEALAIHRIGTRRDRAARVAELLELVGLRPEWAVRYPHQFSGGQKQRIAIARALASNPEFIVLDEPVSALDVSIQSQILRLLADLQQRLGLTYLLIAHDLAVVGQMCQRVAVMYLGKIVEIGERDRLYRLPLHPYTRALFSAVPVPDPAVERTRRRIILQGDVPSPVVPPAGCRFHTRCPIAVERCRVEEPPLRELTPGQRVACHLAEQMAALPPQSALTPGSGLPYSPPGSG